MFCNQCGKEIEERAKFCRFCGASVQIEEKPIVKMEETSDVKNLIQEQPIVEHNTSNVETQLDAVKKGEEKSKNKWESANKKLIAIMLVVIIAVLAAAIAYNKSQNNASIRTTEKGDISDAQVEEANEGIVGVDLVVNRDSENTEEDFSVLGQKNEKRRSLYYHVNVKSENPEAYIRLKIESRWGLDGVVKEKFQTESDEKLKVDSNTWNTKTSGMASNLYYWRITIYKGLTDEVLATRTIFTPFDNTADKKEDMENKAPSFRNFGELSKEEKRVFDYYYALVGSFNELNSINEFNVHAIWEYDGFLLMCATVKSDTDSDMMWFVVDKNDKNNIQCEENSKDLSIPDKLGDADTRIDFDKYYLSQAFTDLK